MFFLNQEINPATTSNLESKSKPRIKEHEHQTNKGKKNKKNKNKKNKNKNKNKNKRKNKKKTWTSLNQRASTRANIGKPTQNHTQTKPSKE